jgi:hypothetical protein
MQRAACEATLFGMAWLGPYRWLVPPRSSHDFFGSPYEMPGIIQVSLEKR